MIFDATEDVCYQINIDCGTSQCNIECAQNCFGANIVFTNAASYSCTGSVCPPTPTPSTSTSSQPTISPSYAPSDSPTILPSKYTSVQPTKSPTQNPTSLPSKSPSITPSITPSISPTINFTSDPNCDHGILNGDLCCASQCGECGGPGCDTRPGGNASCCRDAVVSNGRICNNTTAPCIIVWNTNVTTPEFETSSTSISILPSRSPSSLPTAASGLVVEITVPPEQSVPATISTATIPGVDDYPDKESDASWPLPFDQTWMVLISIAIIICILLIVVWSSFHAEKEKNIVEHIIKNTNAKAKANANPNVQVKQTDVDHEEEPASVKNAHANRHHAENGVEIEFDREESGQ